MVPNIVVKEDKACSTMWMTGCQWTCSIPKVASGFKILKIETSKRQRDVYGHNNVDVPL